MVYDPFSQIQCENNYCTESIVSPPALLISASEPGKLFGFDESFVVGVVIGILIMNFVDVMR